ncbi:MAG TPA: complex I subunit 1 family protein [Phycisphaerales bacterium]|nr:complex I subunit 1 family protein [Phycisphaerales bacterium]
MDTPSWLTAQLLVSVLTIVVVVHVLLIGCAMAVYMERKVSAYIQDRVGPNRVGFDFGLAALAPLKGMLGLGQSLADGLKFILKEDFTPARVDKALFTLAPIIVVTPALMGFVVIPWGGRVEVPDFTLPLVGWHIEGGIVHVAGAAVNVGIVYLLATAALGVYGVALGGYAGNNKFSFLGGLRATAQMISYEVPLGLALMTALLALGTVLPDAIVRQQASQGWLLISQPVAALIFYIAILAEANRAPFDNAEAEQELVGGYHTEYSAMRFALFFLAEYAHLITSSAFFALLFLGGYHLPGVGLLSPESVGVGAVLAKFGVYAGKVTLLVFLSMLIRWTIPRLRYDQIMMGGWQLLIPLALADVVMVCVMIYFNLTGLVPMLIANAALAAAGVVAVGFMPANAANRRVPLYGSRFCPMPGEPVRTQSSEPLAHEDRPVQGSMPA